jgi:hypothetical protein
MLVISKGLGKKMKLEGKPESKKADGTYVGK